MPAGAWICRVTGCLIAALYLTLAASAFQSPKMIVEGRFVPKPTGLPHTGYGRSLDYEDQHLVVGEPAYLGGTIWTYTRTAGVWVEDGALNPVAQLLVSGGMPGSAVLLRGNDLFVGAPGSYPAVGPNHQNGSVVLYVRSGGAWSASQVLDDPTIPPSTFAEFGKSLAIDGDTLVIGAPFDDVLGNASGSTYVFVRDPLLGWVQQTKLWPLDGAANHWFGHSVQVEGSTLIVGAPMDSAQLVGPGWVYAYERDDNGTPSNPFDDLWVQQSKLVSPLPATNNKFGWTLALEGDRLAVGEVAGEGAATDSGAVHVFERTGPGAAWTLQATLLDGSGKTDDRFGQALEADGDDLFVGATQLQFGAMPLSGGVFRYRKVAGAWATVGPLVPFEPNATLGDGMAFDGDRLVVGAAAAPTSYGGQANIGAVFSFRAANDLLDTFCFGSPFNCPCGNGGNLPGGCFNGGGLPGLLVAIGPVVGDGSGLEFFAMWARPEVACLLFVGPAKLPAPVPFSNGVMCIGGGITRLGAKLTDPKMGTAAWGPAVGAGLGWGPGQSLNFQAWYRDMPGPCTGSNPGGSNLTNGVQVTLLP
jgi:hypothetical protein